MSSDFLKRLREQSAVKPAETQVDVSKSADVASQAAPETQGQTGLRFAFGRKPTGNSAALVPAQGGDVVRNDGAAAPNDSGEHSVSGENAVTNGANSNGEFNSGPANFQSQLDRLDALCQSAAGIDPLAHASVKAHVKGIMIDLIANPEMRGLVLDRDMHNIMKFIQSSADTADTKFAKTAVNRQKRTAKAGLASNFDAAFDNLLLSPPSLDSVGTMNTDNIKPKVR